MVVPHVADRRGVIAAEWIVAIALLFVLVGLAADLITRLTDFGFTQLSTAEWEQQATLAGQVLHAELRRGTSGLDWVTHPGDSVRLRAFRGTGWICPGQSSGSSVSVVFSGDRRPNPAKDSVLVIGAEGRAVILPLRGRRAGGACVGIPPGQVEEWDLGPSPPAEAVLRLFESGAYSVSSGALRYRVGRGGRQPVVGNSFDTASALTVGAWGVPDAEAAVLVLVQPVGPYVDRRRIRRSESRGRRSPP